MIELSTAGLSVSEHAKQAAEVVKSQHLPQIAVTLESAVSILKQTSGHAAVVAYVPWAVLGFGIAVAASLTMVGAGLLIVAAALGQTFAATANTKAEIMNPAAPD